MKLFSPTIHYPYSRTHRWRKCDWLIYGVVVMEISTLIHICASQCDPCLTKWVSVIDSLPVKLLSPTIHYPYSRTHRWRKCDWLIYGAVVVEISTLTHICASQCDPSLTKQVPLVSAIDSLPVKLFSPTIHYPYSCTHRWRKCDWLIYGAVVVEISTLTHICFF